ncbi:hybrid sensor histidine kinase/response regulator [Sabulicella glaciei]|uniref:histidine kinase n=1 Tax=Sabulicella glaciei TaxID=2984948 RepID=A0ABT3NSB4_9PROT|nr:hybrid sensor histidine kinase/response regulator [Roseococcus sp. MDT2-1-1]MCW8085037.1 ATP-binding protein [Roseococcus sp. MDT2-1-1]
MKPRPEGKTTIPSRLGVLRVLAFLALAVPVALLAAYALSSHRFHQREAEGQVVRTLDLLHEHGTKVFDTYEILLAYADELVRGLDDDQLREREAEISGRLQRFKQSLPQIQNVWIIGSTGFAVASTQVVPVPRDLNVSDREYFRALRDGETDLVISDVINGRVRPETRFFQFARRRSPRADGGFAGIVAVSVQPSYFVEYYGKTPASGLTTASLVRDDAYLLARFPALNPSATRRVSDGSAFRERTAEAPERGLYVGRSLQGGTALLLAYRRLPSHPVYVVTGLDMAIVRARWLQSLILPALLAVPTALALFGLVWVAIRQARGLEGAVAELTAERVLREAAEEERRQVQRLQAQRQRQEALGQLAGGIAHDINNVMQAVGTGAALIRRRASDAAAVENLARMIEASAERGGSVTRRLLAFARRGELRAEAVDPEGVLREIHEVLAHSLDPAIRMEVRAEAPASRVFVDRGQLETVLLNLATNARDAMPSGGRLTLFLEAREIGPEDAAEGLPTGRYVALGVSDTGAGMDAETLARASDPFFTTKEIGKGTGLGLAIARSFAEQSGGQLCLSSRRGEGTVAEILLPVAEGRAPPATVQPAPAGPRRRILLVDDEDLVRATIARGLEEYGHAVLPAADAEAALVLLGAGAEVEVLVTDLAMPRMNGLDLIAAARVQRPGLPAVLVTGNAVLDEARTGGLPPGPFLVLRKPFGIAALAQGIGEVAPPPSVLAER